MRYAFLKEGKVVVRGFERRPEGAICVVPVHLYGKKIKIEDFQPIDPETGLPTVITRAEPVLDANGDPVFEDIEVPTYDVNGDPILDANGDPVTETIQQQKFTYTEEPLMKKRAILDTVAQEAFEAEEAAKKADRLDQDSKRQVRIEKLVNAIDNLDKIVQDPVKLEKLLKHIIIGVAKLRER